MIKFGQWKPDMIKWQRLNYDQLEELGLGTYEGEVVLVDLAASSTSPYLFMFDAQDTFSEKQLSKYKHVTPKELETLKDKLYEAGKIYSMDEDNNDDSGRPDRAA